MAGMLVALTGAPSWPFSRIRTIRLALRGIWKCESIANQGQGFPVTFQKVEFSTQGIKLNKDSFVPGHHGSKL